jgi:hypothetical protein
MLELSTDQIDVCRCRSHAPHQPFCGMDQLPVVLHSGTPCARQMGVQATCYGCLSLEKPGL